MIIQEPGKVTDRITLLGRREACIYHLDGGSDAVLLGGGMIHIIPDVLEQVAAFNIVPEKISRIIILHSHFDHCGIVGFFKKRWPWMTVAASSQAKEMLQKPKIIESIRFMNEQVIDRFNSREKLKDIGVDAFAGLSVEAVLGEGEKITCGDRTLEIIEVPGHSSCSIAAYVPEEKAMFTSDAAGIAAAGKEIFTAANSNFDKYQQSLEKMNAYDVEVQLAEHYGARTGKDGRTAIANAIEAARNYRSRVEASLERTGTPEKSAAELTEITIKNASAEFLPEAVVSLVTSQMVHFIDKNRA
jgi:2-aminobenzoylacetyl-CoA thioesterase